MNRPSKGVRSTASDSMTVTTTGLSQAEKLDWFQDKFRPHFDEWVFGRIDRLVDTQDALVGFIMMTCAIDWLTRFWREDTDSIGAGYKGFIKQYFPRRRYNAQGLWKSLRCGLVHMFTIQNTKYALIHNHPELHLKSQDGHIVLNAQEFRDDLVAAKEKYFNEVESSPELLRKVWKRYRRDGFLDVYALDKVP